jgi:CRISPR/Cas system-associated endonuclease Cas1
MTFLEQIEVEKVEVKFWKGIDIDKILNHPKDGSSGFMIVLFDSIKQEKIDYKITSILDNSEIDFDKFIDTVDNNYVMLYQTNGLTDELISAIKKKFTTCSWQPIAPIVPIVKK